MTLACLTIGDHGLGMAQPAAQLSSRSLVTPHRLPDLSCVEVELRPALLGTLVTDAGATVEGLRSRLAQRLPQRVRMTVEGICRMNDLRFERGAVEALVERGGDVHEAVDRVGRVCARIARLKLE